MLRLSRWRPSHLLLGWIGYWLVLALVTVGPGIAAAWNATNGPASAQDKASISASMADGVVTATVMEGTITTWTASASLLSIILWVALPPLVLWVLWARARGAESRRREVA